MPGWTSTGDGLGTLSVASGGQRADLRFSTRQHASAGRGSTGSARDVDRLSKRRARRYRVERPRLATSGDGSLRPRATDQKPQPTLAVLETADNASRSRESRDLDIPLCGGAHFAYHAGWAQLMAKSCPATARWASSGRSFLEFPLLMLSWKVAPALAMGNVVV